ncbi:MAG: hypothetical protein RLZZ76_85 [Candidatus Parcubacteria bacterium]|jgi:release factor glutamine methyltransferase
MTKEEQWLLKEKYHGEKSEGFFTDCKRLESGEPLAYIIGSIPFLNTTIHLESHPLIPRPETEFWVEKAIAHIKHAGKPEPRVLDLCAGSGAIGVAVAKEIPLASVTFAEIDPTHFSTIEKNLKENTIIYDREKYVFLESDLFLKVSGSFDFILTNPPYIDKGADTAEKSVTDYEPHLALFGGVHGMEYITRIITDAPKYLTATGELWIEHEPAQAEAIKTLATDSGFLCTIHTDQYKVARYSVLTMAQ